jgi:uracil-DNA glycosylase
MNEATRLVLDLADVRLPDVFNPYADVCPVFDLPDAPAHRRATLTCVLHRALEGKGGAMWVGLELGHGGGRRTGLPMTAEQNLRDQQARWSVSDLQVCTRAGPKRELTSTVVWRALAALPEQIFLWNVFPLHSHPAGKPLKNRRHTAAEAALGLEFLERLVALLEPTVILAIGNDAQSALKRRRIEHLAARHPAYGGVEDFLRDVHRAHCT